MKKIPLLIGLLACALMGWTQGFENSLARFANGTTYLDINRNNFVVNNAPGDFANYHLSVLKLGTELAKIAGQTAPYNTGSYAAYNTGGLAYNVLNRFTAYRLEYTEPISFGIWGSTRLRCIIVRPNNMLPGAPCILATSGNGANMDNFGSQYIVQVADLLMRGYAVLYYENLGSSRPTSNGTPINVAGALANLLAQNDVNLVTHLSFLNGEAAAKLATDPIFTSLVGTDPSKLFTLGFSAGSLVTHATLLGKRADFPASFTPWSGITPRDEFTYLSGRANSFSIRGGIIMGGSLLKLKPGQTNIVDASDASKRWYSIFGVNDATPAAPYNGNADIEGYLAVSSRLSAVGVKHHINPICGAGHTLYASGMDAENLLGSEAMTTLLGTVAATPAATLYATVNSNAALNATLTEFKKINTEAFQVGSTTAKFIQNTLAGTATAMGVPVNSQLINRNSGNISLPFVAESNWVYQFPASCPALRWAQWDGSDDEMLGSEADAADASFTLAPNPTTGMATLSIAASEADLPITVLNLQGQLVHAARMPKGHSQLDLDLSGLPAGIYFVRVQQADGLITTEKLVKE